MVEKAFDFVLEAYGPKYEKAAACLEKDREVLLTFYDFPAMTSRPSMCQSASKKWRRLDGSHQLAEIVRGLKFKDGEKQIQHAA